MQVIRKLNSELESYLNVFRDWAFEQENQMQIEALAIAERERLGLNLGGERACSTEYLMSINPSSHVGYPPELFGVDLNYETLRKAGANVDPTFLNRVRNINFATDSLLQSYLGAKVSALKAYYPAEGYIAWHTNWNAPGYNIIFTYSKSGNGYWRHINPKDSTGPEPDQRNLVHVDDNPGWHCKVGYFGSKSEFDKIMWHSAYTKEPRLTLAYIIYDRLIWENLIEEIRGE